MSGELVLFLRPGCHLCEEAEEALRSLGIPYITVDITKDESLERKYGLRIPVLAQGERVLAEGRIGRAELERLIPSLETPRPAAEGRG